MLDLPMPTEDTPEQLPLPLIVAKRWNFPLAHVETPNGTFYAVQDWLRRAYPVRSMVRQAQETSDLLQMDLATGRPLLPGGTSL